MKEKYYLDYNKDNIFINLIQSEDHFKYLGIYKFADPEVEGFANCIVKHLADAEGEASEAVSHSLVVEGSEPSTKFRKLKDGLRAFRKRLQTSYVSPDEGIKAIRKLRREFEGFNVEYDVSKCESCGPTTELLRALTKFKGLEKKKLNTNNPYTHVGERKMAYNMKAIASDALVGFVAGTGGAAIHFLGFAPKLDAYTIMGVRGGAIADIVVGLVSVVAGSQVRQEWLKSLLYLLGTTLMGLGVAHAAGWTTPAVGVGLRVAAPSPVIAPTRVGYPVGLPGQVVNKHGTVPEVPVGTYA